MAVSASTFKSAHPEFESIPDPTVETALADALADIDVDIWGDDADRGQRLLAAHYLAMTPSGGQAGLRAGAGANQTSIYWGRYEDLRRRVGMAHRPVLE